MNHPTLGAHVCITAFGGHYEKTGIVVSYIDAPGSGTSCRVRVDGSAELLDLDWRHDLEPVDEMRPCPIRCTEPRGTPRARPGAEALDTAAYTGTMVRAARAEALELWPDLPITSEQVEILIGAALARAGRDLDAGLPVALEYIGTFARSDRGNGPLVTYRPAPALLEIHHG